MIGRRSNSWYPAAALAASLSVWAALPAQAEQTPAPAVEVTFAKHISPILQRSCENCHRTGGVAPMALQTYEQARPWARSIKTRTGIGPRAGVMPPWYVEKEIGIQHFKNDPSLSDEEIGLIAKWADTGAARGNVADLPPARVWNDSTRWSIGEPDLVVRTSDILVKGDAPDWWGEIPPTATGLTEDRYVSALEVREVNDVDVKGTGRETVGGRYVFHHMIWSTKVIDAPEEAINPNEPFSLAALFGIAPGTTTWPVHEVGREADFFDPKSARRRVCSRPVRRSCPTRSTCIRTAATPRPTSKSASSSCPRATSPTTAPRTSASATAWTSTSRAWTPASS